MPEREIGVGGGAHALGIRRVVDVEQQAVPAARSAGVTDRRIDRDIVALRRPAIRTNALAPAVPFDAVRDNGKRIGAQRGAIGACGRASAATRLDDTVELCRDELVAEDDVAAFEGDDVPPRGAGGIHFLLKLEAVLGSLAVPLRRDEPLENARRADDVRLLGMVERDLNDLDSE